MYIAAIFRKPTETEYEIHTYIFTWEDAQERRTFGERTAYMLAEGWVVTTYRVRNA